MTKPQRKKIIFKACELIEANTEEYSCNAIDQVCGVFQSDLRAHYADFYLKSDYDAWKEMGTHSPYQIHRERHKRWRIMLMLWFAEVGPEGVE